MAPSASAAADPAAGPANAGKPKSAAGENPGEEAEPPVEPEVVTPEVVTPAGPDRPLAQGRILYGDASRFDHPAVIRLDDVIRAIAAYRKISSGSVQVDSAEYLILASRGTRVLRSAVRIAAKHYGFDLVGERGQVWLPGGTPIPDITRQVSAVVRQMRLAE